jgi:hypothetical protein
MLVADRGIPAVRGRTVALLFAVGFVVQSGALWLRGTGDVLVFKEWALTSLARGLPSSYSLKLPSAPGIDANAAVPDYPPLSVYLLAGAGRMAMVVDPDVTVRSRLLTLFVKAPVVLSLVAIFSLLLYGVSRATRDRALARYVALAYWLNPAVILNGPALGYLDPICWLPGVCAVVAASLGWAGSAGLLAAASALIKPQGLFFFLPVASALWNSREFGLARATLCASTAIVLTVLPFVLTTPLGFAAGMQVNFTEDLLSGDAMNFWWIVQAAGSLWARGLSTLNEPMNSIPLQVFIAWTGFNPRPWMAAFVILTALWLFWQVRGRPGFAPHTAMCALAVHIYCVFAVSVHENHLVYAIPLIGLTTLCDRRYRRLYIGVSAFVVVNLVLFYGLGRDFAAPPRAGLFWPLTVTGAFAGIALLAYHVQVFRQAFLGSAVVQTAPAPPSAWCGADASARTPEASQIIPRAAPTEPTENAPRIGLDGPVRDRRGLT